MNLKFRPIDYDPCRTMGLRLVSRAFYARAAQPASDPMHSYFSSTRCVARGVDIPSHVCLFELSMFAEEL